MLNEYVYCPRLFYYEWVEGVFAHNRETVEGEFRHSKIDGRHDDLTPAEDLAPEDRLDSYSVTLSSESHQLIATLDLVTSDAGSVVPVDYKRGSLLKNNESGEIEAWPPVRTQIAVQALMLRDTGYSCNEGIVYYVKTKQRVRVAINQA